MDASLLTRINDFRITPAERLLAARQLAGEWKPDLSADCEIDLHCHTFYSDGYNSPAMLVFEAFRRGMKAIAISDHDVFDGQLEAITAGDIFGIRIVPAAEFYTSRSGIEILGFFPDIKHFQQVAAISAYNPIVKTIRAAKKIQLEAMLGRIPECFSLMGFTAEINAADIDCYLRNGISTKGDISVAMWQKYGEKLAVAGIAVDVKDFQARYTTKDQYLNVPLKLDLDISPEAIVRWICSLGGLPGLAHPTELRKKEGQDNAALRQVIAGLAGAGMQCIEVDGWRNAVCPESGIYQTDLFEQMRQEYNIAHPESLPLLATNGGDSHNQPGEGLELGCGYNHNLRPDCGKFTIVSQLEQRQQLLYFTTVRQSQ
jgi:hypothetical protein